MSRKHEVRPVRQNNSGKAPRSDVATELATTQSTNLATGQGVAVLEWLTNPQRTESALVIEQKVSVGGHVFRKSARVKTVVRAIT